MCGGLQSTSFVIEYLGFNFVFYMNVIELGFYYFGNPAAGIQ